MPYKIYTLKLARLVNYRFYESTSICDPSTGWVIAKILPGQDQRTTAHTGVIEVAIKLDGSEWHYVWPKYSKIGNYDHFNKLKIINWEKSSIKQPEFTEDMKQQVLSELYAILT